MLKNKKMLYILFFLAIFNFKMLYAFMPISYINGMGQENWQMQGNPLRCGLSFLVPNYGMAYFEQYATKSPHFIIRNWQENLEYHQAVVFVSPPAWKPYGRKFKIMTTKVTPGEFGLRLPRNATIQILTFLAQGYQASVRYHSEQGFNTTVTLTPIKFQKMYARYQRCLGKLLTFTYEDVAETVLYFPSEDFTLEPEDRKRLRLIAQYVRADEQIEKIRIVGYSDSSGRHGYNNAVSEGRAKAVGDYLLKLGVPDEKISLTWMADARPVSRNDTDAGRAANRRVEINLIKK